jgi:hypothetical protein
VFTWDALGRRVAEYFAFLWDVGVVNGFSWQMFIPG